MNPFSPPPQGILSLKSLPSLAAFTQDQFPISAVLTTFSALDFQAFSCLHGFFSVSLVQLHFFLLLPKKNHWSILGLLHICQYTFLLQDAIQASSFNYPHAVLAVLSYLLLKFCLVKFPLCCYDSTSGLFPHITQQGAWTLAQVSF